MFWVGDVLGHDVDVVSVGQQVREEFGGGQLSDKVVAVQEVCVVGEEILILRLEILAGDSLVSCQQVSEGREGVRCHTETRTLHILKELFESVGEENNRGERLVEQTLPEHDAGVVADGDVVVALAESHQDLV